MPPSASASAPDRPGYVIADRGRYGYEPALTEADRAARRVAAPVQMMAFNGVRPSGALQLMPLPDSDLHSTGPEWAVVYEWVPGAPFFRRATYHRGKFSEGEFLRAVPGSLVMVAMEDARRGRLERYIHRPGGGKAGFPVVCDERRGCMRDGGVRQQGPQ